jgi:hypothetical protein
MINQNVSGVNIKQINIAPTLSSFPIPDGQRKYYEQYRCSKITYTIMPLDIVNQTQGANQLDLAYVYIVPITTEQIPTAA